MMLLLLLVLKRNSLGPVENSCQFAALQMRLPVPSASRAIDKSRTEAGKSSQ
jgi:hypothetical protein